jgi:excinuclease ABC subunit A
LPTKRFATGERLSRQCRPRLPSINRTNIASGGEAQRIRPASQIGADWWCYVRTRRAEYWPARQITSDRLNPQPTCDLGNTVIVEHDEEGFQPRDYMLDIGPGAGAHGIVVQKIR